MHMFADGTDEERKRQRQDKAVRLASVCFMHKSACFPCWHAIAPPLVCLLMRLALRDLQEGEKMIAQFMSSIAGLPIDSMDDAELLAKVTAMKYDNVFDVVSMRLAWRDWVGRRAMHEYGLTVPSRSGTTSLEWTTPSSRTSWHRLARGGLLPRLNNRGRFTWRQLRFFRMHYRFRLGASHSLAKLGLVGHAKPITKLLAKYCKVPNIGHLFRNEGV
jgi:hypothetical protein